MPKRGIDQEPIGDGRRFKGRKNIGYRQDSKRINYGVEPEVFAKRVNPTKLKKYIKDTGILKKDMGGSSRKRGRKGS